MRSVIVLFLSFLLSTSGIFARAQYSAFTRSFIAHLHRVARIQTKTGSEPALSDDVKRDYLIRSTARGPVVHAMVEVQAPDVPAAELEQLGIAINSKIGKIWTLLIPVDVLETLGEVAGISYISIDSPIRLKLDDARAETKTTLVNDGTDLPQGYTGEGVVIGVIDGGFDLLHPTFQNDAGASRIVRVWSQSTDGAPPAGYSYGTEYATADTITAIGFTGGGSHGAHVAGIAGGSGRNTPAGKFKGVAHRAELILVELGGGASAVADAAKYIFDYAASVGKPAVVNMSLGTHIGPHDGTSAQDQAFNALVGNGKVLVGAAGNEGGTALHLSYTFGAADETVGTIVQFEGAQPQTGSGLIDIWGSTNSTFSVALKILDAAGAVLAETSPISSTRASNVQDQLAVGADVIKYEITPVASSPTNQRPNILVSVDNPTTNNVALYVTAANGTVHLWNHGKGTGAAFVTLAAGGTFLPGNTDATVGEIGGTAAGVLTVGAYTTKNSYINSTGQSITVPFNTAIGELAPFSSLGPTLDGRIKPDVTAPGNVIISAVQITDAGYNADGSKFGDVAVNGDNSTTGKYASQQGTSMATPMATGIIALMLQAQPKLSPDEIKAIFGKTSRADGQTGTIEAGGNNRWGRGKIDAHESLKLVLSTPAMQASHHAPALERKAGVLNFSTMIPSSFLPPLVPGYDSAGLF